MESKMGACGLCLNVSIYRSNVISLQISLVVILLKIHVKITTCNVSQTNMIAHVCFETISSLPFLVKRQTFSLLQVLLHTSETILRKVNKQPWSSEIFLNGIVAMVTAELLCKENCLLMEEGWGAQRVSLSGLIAFSSYSPLKINGFFGVLFCFEQALMMWY